METVKDSWIGQFRGEGRRTRQSTEDVKVVKILCDTIMMDVIINLSKPIECTTQRVNPNVNYGLGVIMCRCRFIDCDRCSTLVVNVDNGEGCACVEVGSIWEISELSAQFC